MDAAIAYPPSEVTTTDLATSYSAPPYHMFHIEAASTDTTKGAHNKTERTMHKRSRFLRNKPPQLCFIQSFDKRLAVTTINPTPDGDVSPNNTSPFYYIQSRV